MDYFVSMSLYCTCESIIAMTNDCDTIAMEGTEYPEKSNGFMKKIVRGLKTLLSKIYKGITTFIREFKMYTGRIIKTKYYTNDRFNGYENEDDKNAHIENKSSNARVIIREMKEIAQQFGHIAAYLEKSMNTSYRRFSSNDDKHSGEYDSEMSADEIFRLNDRITELRSLMIRVDKVFSKKYEDDIKTINAHLNSLSNHIDHMIDMCNSYENILNSETQHRYEAASRMKELNALNKAINVYSINLANFMRVCQSALR